MGSQERMTEQKGERIGGKTQLIPKRWEGRRLCGDRVVFYHHCACELSLGACPNPPGHPPAPGPLWHGKLRHRDAFWYRNSVPFAQPDKGIFGQIRDPHQASPPFPGERRLGGQDQRSCGWRQHFARTGCVFRGSAVGFWPGEGVPMVLLGQAAWGQNQTL